MNEKIYKLIEKAEKNLLFRGNYHGQSPVYYRFNIYR